MSRDLRHVIDALQAGVVVLDRAGQVEQLNAQACRFLQVPAEAVLGAPVERLAGAGHAMSRLSRSVLASGLSAQESDLRLERRHDADALLDVAASPLFDARGESDGVVLVLRDRTQQKRLLQLEAERERFQALGQLAAGLAHEIKNPLGGIRGAAELLARRATDDKARETAELIVRESTRIASLVEDLMVFSRGEALALRPVNIHEVLDGVLALLALDPLAAGIAIERSYDPSLPEFLADPDRLTQVFLNLARNALQAMAPGRRHARGHEPHDPRPPRDDARGPARADARGLDRGHGARHAGGRAPPGDDALLHDAQRRHGARPRGGRLLGDPARRHASPRERGRPRHPRARDAPAPPPRRAAAPPRAQERAVSESARVLVADDEASIRFVLRETLESAGHEVVEVASGEAALEALAAGRFDLAFFDIRMPGPSGLELLEQVRTLGSDVAVVIVTAQNTFENAVEAMKRGALDYLVKPFGVDAVLALVTKVMRTRALERELRTLRREVGKKAASREQLVGRSPALLEVFKTIGRVATSDIAVLITGESGTGKELVARAIHQASARSEGPFVAVNARRSRASSSRASSSATSAAPSRARSSRARAASARRGAGRSSSTRSATCRSSSRRSSCACSRAER